MIYGYARVSTDGQSVNAQVAALKRHGAGKVFREVASGGKTERAASATAVRLYLKVTTASAGRSVNRPARVEERRR